MSTFPSEGLLLEVLRDDRMLMRLDSLEAKMDLSDFIHARVAEQVGDGCTLQEMRGWVRKAALAQVSLMRADVFRVLRSYPYCLSQGDIEHNLRMLAAGPCPGEPTTRKIYNLIVLGSHGND